MISWEKDTPMRPNVSTVRSDKDFLTMDEELPSPISLCGERDSGTRT